MPKVLLHCCCAPCSSAIIEWMMANAYEPVLYYCNPNIYPHEEYLIRKNECTRYAQTLGLQIIDADYDHQAWQCAIRGHEEQPERGSRCLECFKLRLLRAAHTAQRLGIDTFTTTLASSRWKSLDQISQAGHWAAEQVNANLSPGQNSVTFDARNWRKGGLQQRRDELLRQNRFYNQEYCGCEYSLDARLPKMSKTDIRRWIRQIKQGLADEFTTLRKRESEQICHKIISASLWHRADTVLLYHPLPDEVDTTPLLTNALRTGKRIILPKVNGDNLTLHEYRGPESLAPGAFGIMEPITPSIPLPTLCIPLAIIPAVAYDPRGHRLGRGRGYYDRLLPALGLKHSIGVCFSFQLLQRIPIESHDIIVSEVVSTHCVPSQTPSLF